MQEIGKPGGSAATMKHKRQPMHHDTRSESRKEKHGHVLFPAYFEGCSELRLMQLNAATREYD